VVAESPAETPVANARGGRRMNPPEGIYVNSPLRIVRILFWLKAVQMWRGFTRDWTSALGILLALALIGPLSILVGVGLAYAFAYAGDVTRINLLRGFLLSVYVLWLVLPLLGQMLTESFDLKRLIHFPVTPRMLFQAFIFSTPLDFSVWFLLPALVAIVVRFSAGALHALVIAAILAVFVFHTVSLSQVVVYFGAGLARSRRLRETLWIAISLSGMLVYLLTQFLQGWVKDGGSGIVAFARSPLWNLANALPPGYTAQAIARWQEREYYVALLWIVPLLAVTYATLRLAGWVLDQIFLGQRGPHRLRPPTTAVPTPSPRPGTPRITADGTRSPARRPDRIGVAPPPPSDADAPLRPLTASVLFPVPRLAQTTRALVAKEILSFFREPFFKMSFLNELIVPLFFGGYFLIASPQPSEYGHFAKSFAFFLPFFAVLMQGTLASNMFGGDGHASATLFQFPVPRRDLLIGKNLALFAAFSVVNTFIVSIAILVTGMVILGLLVLGTTLGTSLLVISVGNVVSVFLPYRTALKGWRIQRQSASRGCGFAFFQILTTNLTILLVVPLAAALLIPYFWIGKIWLLLTVPVAIAYAVGFYFVSLRVACPLLESREPEIVATLTSEF
jgi:hypothetical protein